MSRPIIAIPGRFTESASALRYRGRRRRAQAARGRLGRGRRSARPAARPTGPDAVDWASRLRGRRRRAAARRAVTSTRVATAATPPTCRCTTSTRSRTRSTSRWPPTRSSTGSRPLAVCRGLHVVNALLGRHARDRHGRQPPSPRAHGRRSTTRTTTSASGNVPVACSCYHHQAVDRVADGITVLGRAEDGVVEAVSIASHRLGRGRAVASRGHLRRRPRRSCCRSASSWRRPAARSRCRSTASTMRRSSSASPPSARPAGVEWRGSPPR